MTSATKSAKISTLNQNIVNLATAATTWGQQDNQGSYDSISLSKLISSGVLSNAWGNGASSKNPFAGGLSIQSANSGNGFIITANDIPSDVCNNVYGSSTGQHKVTIPTADSWECTSNTLKVAFGQSLD